MSIMLEAFEDFWKKHPALLYGLGLLLGTALAFNPLSFYIVIPILFLSWSARSRVWLLISFILFSAWYVQWHIHFPELGSRKIEGTAIFKIDSLVVNSTHFGKQYLYCGTMTSFSTIPELKNVPITISVSAKKEITRPPADKDYFIDGTLIQKTNGRYVFKADKRKPWISIKNTSSSAENRFLCKEKIIQYIKTYISDSASGTFLAGIATGCFDDRHMSADFSRFGLQHIMAISGFHFSIIASFLSIFLGIFLQKKHGVILTIFLLTSYFLFLGCSASILRAWIAILITLSATLLKREGQALNSLGVGLIAVLAYDPLLYNNLGFQFSFLTTASILLFYSRIDRSLQKAFAKRSLEHAIEMNHLTQYGFLILTFLRQAAALTAAVNVTAFPMTLYYFGEYPILGMVYNVFFPFLVSFSMLLLMLGMSLPFLTFIHSINSSYTKFLLGFTDGIPRDLDLKIYLANTPVSLLCLYLTMLFFVSVPIIYKSEQSLT